jgi:hypothetical protein
MVALPELLVKEIVVDKDQLMLDTMEAVVEGELVVAE